MIFIIRFLKSNLKKWFKKYDLKKGFKKYYLKNIFEKYDLKNMIGKYDLKNMSGIYDFKCLMPRESKPSLEHHNFHLMLSKKMIPKLWFQKHDSKNMISNGYGFSNRISKHFGAIFSKKILEAWFKNYQFKNMGLKVWSILYGTVRDPKVSNFFLKKSVGKVGYLGTIYPKRTIFGL